MKTFDAAEWQHPQVNGLFRILLDFKDFQIWKTKERLCLRCERTFKSSWNGQRRCLPCRTTLKAHGGDRGFDERSESVLPLL